MVIYNCASEKIDGTSRITFEILKREHAENLFDSLNDDRIYKYIPLLRYDTKGRLEDRFIKLSSKGPNDGTCIWLNWVLKEKTIDQYIGWIQATIYDNGKAALAYVIFPKYWKQGYAKEACYSIIDHVFAAYSSIESIFVEVDTRNTASIQLAERLGFMLVGEKKDADYFNGSKSDEYTFELERIPK